MTMESNGTARNGISVESSNNNNSSSSNKAPNDPPESSSAQGGGGGDEETSLLHLYESRLRRLRDYESRVFSKYGGSGSSPPNSDTTEAWQISALEGPQSRYDGYYRPSQPKTVSNGKLEIPISDRLYRSSESQQPQRANPLNANCNDPPSVINLNNDDDGEILDDITVSTGMNSNMTPASEVRREVIVQKYVDPPVAGERDVPVEETEDTKSKSSGNNKENSSNSGSNDKEQSVDADGEQGSANGSRDADRHTRNSRDGSNFSVTHSSSASNDSQSLNDEDNKSDNEIRYSYSASFDSKYETYALLVDPDQDDRAVEIALYNTKRPHMRAFHFAWLGFFVAFFNWFAITPLLSQVAHSLSLSRAQIWTSSILAVASAAITRVIAGPMNDTYGSRWVMAVSLMIAAIPAIFSGLIIQDEITLYIVRFLVGVGGSAFVTCQFWTSSMYTVEVAGTALSLVAGWGNLGGGVSQIVMGSILFPLFKIIYGGDPGDKLDNVYPEPGDPPLDDASDKAWRTILIFPGLMCAYISYLCIRYADDTPKGNYWKRKKLGMMTEESPLYALKRGACNLNTWLMFVQYSCCFGVELTMTSAAALYFQDEFDQPTESAAAIASIFGWMNLFARGLGGFFSDMACAKYGFRGRLWVQVILLFCEGVLVILFANTDSLGTAIFVMVAFSTFVQAAEGSSFGIVPYIDYAVTGSISGIIGAGGNFGAVGFSLVFRSQSDKSGFIFMGTVALLSSLLSAFVFIPGHRSLFVGEDTREVEERRITHADQVANLPTVDFDHEANRNRQSHLRGEILEDESSPSVDTAQDEEDPSGHLEEVAV